MKSTPFGYLVALIFGIAIGIAIDDQLLQPAPAPKPAPVAGRAENAAEANPLPQKIGPQEIAPQQIGPAKNDAPAVAEQHEPAANPLPADPPPPAGVVAAADVPVPAEAGVPKLLVAEPTFDFGERESGTQVEHTFILENAGTAPLTIKKVHQTGGISLNRASLHEIAAGERIELKATLSLAGQKGRVRREIIVHSDDPAAPQVTLALVGIAEPRIKVDPKRVDFGQIDGQQSASKTFTVSGQRGLTFNILDTRTSGEAITAEVKTLTPGREYEVTATIAPPLKAGAFHGWIHLHTDQRGEYHVIQIPLVAHVGGAD